MRGFPNLPKLAVGILCLASSSLSSPASAGIIAIGGTARPDHVNEYPEIRTLKIPASLYRRLNARLSYEEPQPIEVEVQVQVHGQKQGRRIKVKKQGSCVMNVEETLILIPETVSYQRGL